MIPSISPSSIEGWYQFIFGGTGKYVKGLMGLNHNWIRFIRYCDMQDGKK